MLKEDYGVNGEHKTLGRQIDNAEFKGYVVAKLEELASLRVKVDRNEKILWLGMGGLAVIMFILKFFS